MSTAGCTVRVESAAKDSKPFQLVYLPDATERTGSWITYHFESPRSVDGLTRRPAQYNVQVTYGIKNPYISGVPVSVKRRDKDDVKEMSMDVSRWTEYQTTYWARAANTALRVETLQSLLQTANEHPDGDERKDVLDLRGDDEKRPESKRNAGDPPEAPGGAQRRAAWFDQSATEAAAMLFMKEEMRAVDYDTKLDLWYTPPAWMLESLRTFNPTHNRGCFVRRSTTERECRVQLLRPLSLLASTPAAKRAEVLRAYLMPLFFRVYGTDGAGGAWNVGTKREQITSEPLIPSLCLLPLLYDGHWRLLVVNWSRSATTDTSAHKRNLSLYVSEVDSLPYTEPRDVDLSLRDEPRGAFWYEEAFSFSSLSRHVFRVVRGPRGLKRCSYTKDATTRELDNDEQLFARGSKGIQGSRTIYERWWVGQQHDGTECGVYTALNCAYALQRYVSHRESIRTVGDAPRLYLGDNGCYPLCDIAALSQVEQNVRRLDNRNGLVQSTAADETYDLRELAADNGIVVGSGDRGQWEFVDPAPPTTETPDSELEPRVKPEAGDSWDELEMPSPGPAYEGHIDDVDPNTLAPSAQRERGRASLDDLARASRFAYRHRSPSNEALDEYSKRHRPSEAPRPELDGYKHDDVMSRVSYDPPARAPSVVTSLWSSRPLSDLVQVPAIDFHRDFEDAKDASESPTLTPFQVSMQEFGNAYDDRPATGVGAVSMIPGSPLISFGDFSDLPDEEWMNSQDDPLPLRALSQGRQARCTWQRRVTVNGAQVTVVCHYPSADGCPEHSSQKRSRTAGTSRRSWESITDEVVARQLTKEYQNENSLIINQSFDAVVRVNRESRELLSFNEYGSLGLAMAKSHDALLQLLNSETLRADAKRPQDELVSVGFRPARRPTPAGQRRRPDDPDRKILWIRSMGQAELISRLLEYKDEYRVGRLLLEVEQAVLRKTESPLRIAERQAAGALPHEDGVVISSHTSGSGLQLPRSVDDEEIWVLSNRNIHSNLPDASYRRFVDVCDALRPSMRRFTSWDVWGRQSVADYWGHHVKPHRLVVLMREQRIVAFFVIELHAKAIDEDDNAFSDHDISRHQIYCAYAVNWPFLRSLLIAFTNHMIVEMAEEIQRARNEEIGELTQRSALVAFVTNESIPQWQQLGFGREKGDAVNYLRLSLQEWARNLVHQVDEIATDDQMRRSLDESRALIPDLDDLVMGYVGPDGAYAYVERGAKGDSAQTQARVLNHYTPIHGRAMGGDSRGYADILESARLVAGS